jgi:beta-lactamase regulating signal transducer with metallopeptidase domain
MVEGVAVVGWLFLHTLWQVPLVAALLALAVWARPSASPAARERWAVAALAVVLLAAGATGLTLLPARGDEGAATTAAGAAVLAEVALERDEAGRLVRMPDAPAVAPSTPSEGLRSAPPLLQAARVHIDALVPWLGAGWLMLIVIGLLRLVGGSLLVARTLRAVTPAPPPLAHRFAALAQHLGVSRPPRLLVSLAVRAPVVVGAWRPTVVLPVDLGVGLSAGQFEALLAHELEHVRRRDHVAALLFAVFDRMFAVHPGARWITGSLRSTREFRCDAAALAVAGDAESYARALLALARSRGDRSRSFRLAATDGSLLDRVRVLLGEPRPRRSRGWIPAVLGVGAALLMAGALAALPPTAHVDFTPDVHGRTDIASLIGVGDTWIWVTVIGPLRTDDTFEIVTGVDPEGRAIFEERRADGWRRVVITQDGDELRFSHVVDGSSVNFGDEGREWLAGILATDTIRRQLEQGFLGEWLGPGLGWGTSGDGESRRFTSEVRMSVDQEARAPTILDRQLESLRGEGSHESPGRNRSRFEVEWTFAAMKAHHLAAHGLISAEQLQEHLAELEALDPRLDPDPSDAPADREVDPGEPPPGATWVWITTQGDVVVDADGVWPTERGGRVVIEERSQTNGERRYAARLDAAGALHETYWIDGRDAPLDAVARTRIGSLVDDPSIRHTLAHDGRDDRGRLVPITSIGLPHRSIVRYGVDGSAAGRHLEQEIAMLTGAVPIVDLTRFTAHAPPDDVPLPVRVGWSAFRARHLASHGLIDDDALARHLEALDGILEGAAP